MIGRLLDCNRCPTLVILKKSHKEQIDVFFNKKNLDSTKKTQKNIKIDVFLNNFF